MASFDGKVTEQWHMLANVTTQVRSRHQVPAAQQPPRSQHSLLQREPRQRRHTHHPQRHRDRCLRQPENTRLRSFAHTALRGFKVGAGVNYMAKSSSDITDINFIPSFVIGNATVSYARSSWNLHLNVDNFTDCRYFIAANAAGAYQGNPASVYGGITWNPGLHSR